MRALVLMLSAILVLGLCATHRADARTHRRAPETAAPVATTKPDAQMPVEMKRDPADIALDRKICKGC